MSCVHTAQPNGRLVNDRAPFAHSFKTQRRGCNPSKLTPITTTSATPSVASFVLCLCFWLGQFYTGLRSGFVHAVWHNANSKWALLWFNIDPILRLILYVISNLKPAFVIKSKEQICTTKIRFKEKREKICTLSRNTNHLLCPFLHFTTATTPIWSPKGFWDEARPGEEWGWRAGPPN